MSKVYFTSDTHFSHQFIAYLRGFESIEEHDEAIVETWNRTVTKRDTVWHLGDVTLKRARDIGPILDRLNGTIHLITGNHDRVAPGVMRNAHTATAEWLRYFASIQPFARLKYNGTEALLSHFPYSGEGARIQPDRFSQYRLPDKGMPLIHGHTHDENQFLTTTEQGTPQVHVGWDAWWKPVPWETVWELISKGNDRRSLK